MTKAYFRYVGNEKIVDGIIETIIYQGRIRFTDLDEGSLVGYPTKLTVDGSGSVEVIFETEEERHARMIATSCYLSENMKDMIQRIAEAHCRGWTLLNLHAGTRRALERRGLLEAFELTPKGWSEALPLVREEYRETVSYLATGSFRIGNRDRFDEDNQFEWSV